MIRSNFSWQPGRRCVWARVRIGENINCIDFKTDLQRILFNIYINHPKISSSSDGCCHWQTAICLRFLTAYDFSTSWFLHTTREFHADECDLMANWKWTLFSQTSSKCIPFPFSLRATVVFFVAFVSVSGQSACAATGKPECVRVEIGAVAVHRN